VLVGVNDREDFITEDACWCGGDGVLFWVFVGALGLVMLVSLFFKHHYIFSATDSSIQMQRALQAQR
jgi:hypothetical protein